MKSSPDETAVAVLTWLLGLRLTEDGRAFLAAASDEIGKGASMRRLMQLLSLASRHVRASIPLNLERDEIRLFRLKIGDCNPERWSLLETLRIALLLSFPYLAEERFAVLFEQCFQVADHGESCALYRALPLLPHAERFVTRAKEGCRSNMRTIFEAVACDSGFPARYFDDIAWRQLVLKAVFIDVPLARIESFDTRRSPELARMALDFADERRSAGRPVPAQLWMCLGASPSQPTQMRTLS